MEKSKNQKSKKYFSIKVVIIISYLVSIISNILLCLIFHLTNHSFKWFGYFIHFFTIITIILSLKYVMFPDSVKSTKKYFSITRYFTLILTCAVIFYIIIFIYMAFTQTDKEILFKIINK